MVTRNGIATQAKCSPALVTKYFGSMNKLRDSIMIEAVAKRDAEVVLQGLVTKHPTALAAPEDLKAEARLLLEDPHLTDL